ncbi:MAG: hypothetical protein CK549_05530, partial [Cyanobium sp. Baikal-G2]
MGDRACLQLLCAGLAPGPGLELMKGVAGRVGIVVLGYLGQFGAMEAVVAGVQQAPGLKFRIGMLAV